MKTRLCKIMDKVDKGLPMTTPEIKMAMQAMSDAYQSLQALQRVRYTLVTQELSSEQSRLQSMLHARGTE